MNQDKDNLLVLRVENTPKPVKVEVRRVQPTIDNHCVGLPLSPETGHYRSPMVDPAVQLMQALREQRTGRPSLLTGTGIGLPPLFVTPLGAGY